MPFSTFSKHKKNKMINSDDNYELCPDYHFYRRTNLSECLVCTICEERPPYCYYWTSGLHHTGCINCNKLDTYKPIIKYKISQINDLINHYKNAHNLLIDDKTLNKYKYVLERDKKIYDIKIGNPFLPISKINHII